MRNRDMPAGPGQITESIPIVGPGGRSELFKYDVNGLTKREASAIANMAQLMGSYGALPGEDEEAQKMAKAAVQFADALFDELDKDEPDR